MRCVGSRGGANLVAIERKVGLVGFVGGVWLFGVGGFGVGSCSLIDT